MSNKENKIPQENGENDVATFILPDDSTQKFDKLKKDLETKIRKKRDSRPKIEAQDLKIKVTKPEKEAKTEAQNKQKNLTKITPEQMNLLINGVSNTITFVRKTEDVTIDETRTFSGALYEIADANGWLDDLSFLPYLVLAAAGTQLTITILSKPKKAGTEKKIIESKPELHKVELSPEIPKGDTYDEVDEQELVKKINGV
jgi:hypothetical protein